MAFHSYTQGLPGAGKTTFISMVSILLVVLFKQSVVWAAHGQEALDSGIDMTTILLEDAWPEVRHQFIRLPGAYDTKKGDLVLTVDGRKCSKNSEFKNTKCFLITTGSMEATFANDYGPLHAIASANWFMIDEAQGFGRCEEMIATANISLNGRFWLVDDHR